MSIVSILQEVQISENAEKRDWNDSWFHSVNQIKKNNASITTYVAGQERLNRANFLLFQKQYEGEDELSIKEILSRSLPIRKSIRSIEEENSMFPPVVFRDAQNFGFWGRKDKPLNEGTVLGWSVSKFEEDWMRDRWLELTRPYAELCFKTEDDTLIFSGGVALEDNPHFYIDKGDLIFITAYSNEKARQLHNTSKEHDDIVQQFRDAGLKYKMPIIKQFELLKDGFLCRNEQVIKKRKQMESWL